jgi:hypothetical protein
MIFNNLNYLDLGSLVSVCSALTEYTIFLLTCFNLLTSLNITTLFFSTIAVLLNITILFFSTIAVLLPLICFSSKAGDIIKKKSWSGAF